MPQTDYKVENTPGIPGTIATAIERCVIRSKANTSGAVLAYGRAVVQGTKPEDVILPAANKTDLVGIVARNYIYENAQTADLAFGYADKQEIPVLIAGDIWVEVEEAVAPGDAVFFRHAASIAVGGNTVIGKFRKSADATGVADAATAIQITNARWLTSTTGAGIAQLSINLA